MTLRSILAFILFALCVPSLVAQEASWPSWRGASGNGFAPGTTPPTTWSETENIAWKVALPGHGKSTPIVHGTRIFVLAAVASETAPQDELEARLPLQRQITVAPDELHVFLVLALHRKTGALLWETEVARRLQPSGVHQTNGYASFSPVTDGKLLYASFGSNGVYALDLEDGEVQWTYDIGPQRTRNGWGEAGSPALAGDALIIMADQEDPSWIHVLDAATGTLRWKKERDEPSTWTTPLVVEVDGTLQIVVNGTNAVRSYDATDGKVLWHCGGQTTNAIPSPVSDGRVVVCASGYGGSACFALNLRSRGDLSQAEDGIAWSYKGGNPYVPSPLLIGNRLYLVSKFSGRLTCLDLSTGQTLLDRERLELGNIYASPLGAGDFIYLVDRSGQAIVLRHTDRLEVVARNILDEPIDASPVAVGSALFLRSDSSLYAIGTP